MDSVDQWLEAYASAAGLESPDDDDRRAVQALVERARAEHSELQVDLVAFARRVGECVAEDESTTLDNIRADELYLAFACTTKDTRAIERFRQVFGADIDRVLERARSTGTPREELRQSVEVKLFAGRDGTPHIAKYGGRGSLQGWVRVVVSRMVIDHMRSHAADAEAPVEPTFAEALGDVGLDPGLQLLRERYRDDVHGAIEQAFGALTQKERRLLRGALLERLGTDDLGAMYGVHRTTAARWVDKARLRLVELTHAALRERLGGEEATVRGLVALVRSQLEVSVERLLASKTSE